MLFRCGGVARRVRLRDVEKSLLRNPKIRPCHVKTITHIDPLVLIRAQIDVTNVYMWGIFFVSIILNLTKLLLWLDRRERLTLDLTVEVQGSSDTLGLLVLILFVFLKR